MYPMINGAEHNLFGLNVNWALSGSIWTVVSPISLICPINIICTQCAADQHQKQEFSSKHQLVFFQNYQLYSLINRFRQKFKILDADNYIEKQLKSSSLLDIFTQVILGSILPMDSFCKASLYQLNVNKLNFQNSSQGKNVSPRSNLSFICYGEQNMVNKYQNQIIHMYYKDSLKKQNKARRAFEHCNITVTRLIIMGLIAFILTIILLASLLSFVRQQPINPYNSIINFVKLITTCLSLLMILSAFIYYIIFTRKLVNEETQLSQSNIFMGESQVETTYKQLALSFPILAVAMVCMMVIIGYEGMRVYTISFDYIFLIALLDGIVIFASLGYLGYRISYINEAYQAEESEDLKVVGSQTPIIIPYY